jgi:hypothetical protein
MRRGGKMRSQRATSDFPSVQASDGPGSGAAFLPRATSRPRSCGRLTPAPPALVPPTEGCGQSQLAPIIYNRSEYRISRSVPEPEPLPASRLSRCPEILLSPTRSPVALSPRSPSTWHATCGSASFPGACPCGTRVCVQCITLPTLSEWDGLIQPRGRGRP